MISNANMIEVASRVLRPVKVEDRIFGDVGAAVLSRSGDLFTGVCIDTHSWGLCAERSAIAAMVTAGQYEIRKVVAVWRDGSGSLRVVPPCGICREFMRSVNESNLEAEIILGLTESAILRELLPRHEWPSQ